MTSVSLPLSAPVSVLRPGAITVVMPNRNHGHYISAALEHICTQNRPPDRVIVIDDQSTDDSLAIIAEAQRRFPVIELIANDLVRGTHANLNYGVEQADTEYLFFAAADDLILPGFLERSLSLLDANPHVGFSTTASAEMDGDGLPLPSAPIPPSSPDCHLTPAQVLKMLTEQGGFAWGNTTIYRTRVLRAVGGFPVELHAFADGYLLQQMALAHGCVYIPERLGVWRRNATGYAGSLSRSVDQLRDVAREIEGRMRGRDAAWFPESYIRRFFRRWRYAAALGFLDNGQFDLAGGIAGLSYVEAKGLGLICRGVGKAWGSRVLFARLLPDDTLHLIRRNLIAYLRAQFEKS